MKYNVIIHGDGACSGNPGPGGWACELLFENSIAVYISGGDPQTTNNIMELSAAISAFEYVVANNIAPADIVLRLDSQYVLNGLKDWSRGWIANNWKTVKNQPVKNCALWQRLVELRDTVVSQGGTVDYVYVKGHSGDHQNDQVDAMAVEARDVAALAAEEWAEDPIIIDKNTQ
jgi:ribonuclease HI